MGRRHRKKCSSLTKKTVFASTTRVFTTTMRGSTEEQSIHVEQVRLLRSNHPEWQEEFKDDGVALTEEGPGLSFYAAGVLLLFFILIVLLTIVVCLARLRLWRVNRWKRRHVVLEESSDKDEKENKDDDDMDADGIFKTRKHRDAPADHEYIRRTMRTASGFVRQYLDAKSKNTLTRQMPLPDDACECTESSCASSTVVDDDGDDGTTATVTTIHDDDECPTTLQISFQKDNELEVHPPPPPIYLDKGQRYFDV